MRVHSESVPFICLAASPPYDGSGLDFGANSTFLPSSLPRSGPTSLICVRARSCVAEQEVGEGNERGQTKWV